MPKLCINSTTPWNEKRLCKKIKSLVKNTFRKKNKFTSVQEVVCSFHCRGRIRVMLVRSGTWHLRESSGSWTCWGMTSGFSISYMMAASHVDGSGEGKGGAYDGHCAASCIPVHWNCHTKPWCSQAGLFQQYIWRSLLKYSVICRISLNLLESRFAGPRTDHLRC